MGTSLFLFWAILVGEPSQPKKGKEALLGDLVPLIGGLDQWFGG